MRRDLKQHAQPLDRKNPGDHPAPPIRNLAHDAAPQTQVLSSRTQPHSLRIKKGLPGRRLVEPGDQSGICSFSTFPPRKSCALDHLRKRLGPDSAKRIDRPANGGSTLMLDAKFAACDRPSRSDATLYCAAVASTRASDADGSDITARAPRSPKIAASTGCIGRLHFNIRRKAVAIEAALRERDGKSRRRSRRAPIESPSSAASFTRQSIKRFSASRSIAGGAPATTP